MKKILLLLSAAAFLLAACGPNKPVDPDDPGNDPSEKAAITIDGNFDDWTAIDQNKLVVAKNNSNSPWTYAKSMRVYADADFIYYYFELNRADLADLMAEVKDPHNELPMRINLNIDGEFTSGYTNYSLDGYDYVIEGSLAENGVWTSFDGTLHEWGWREDKGKDYWNEILSHGSGLTMGAGSDNKYEIAVDRKVFNRVDKLAEPKKIGDTFQTGLRFYTPGWDEMSNLPNASMNDHEQGWAHLLEIHTDK